MNTINVVCGYAGSAELTLHYIFTSRKFGPGKSEKNIFKLVWPNCLFTYLNARCKVLINEVNRVMNEIS